MFPAFVRPALFSISFAFALFAQASGPRIENLYGYSVDSEGITFQVFSGGCTSKNSFRVAQHGTSDRQLALYRIIPDPCKAFFPYGVFVRYSYEELNLGPSLSFRVVNPFVPAVIDTN